MLSKTFRRKGKPGKAITPLEALNTSSATNRNLFVFNLSFLAYIWIMVVGTTDLDLFLPDAQMHLPLLGVEIPLLGFYIAAPLLVLGFHFNLLINHAKHMEKLTAWAEEAGKGGHLLLFPFLVNFQLDANRVARFFIRALIWLLYDFLPLFTLGAILWRFADYHSQTLSIVHLGLLLVDFAILSWFMFQGSQQDQAPRFVGRLGLWLVLILTLWPFGLQFSVLWRMLHLEMPNEMTTRALRVCAESKVPASRKNEPDQLPTRPTPFASLRDWLQEQCHEGFWPILDLHEKTLVKTKPSAAMEVHFEAHPPPNDKYKLKYYEGYDLQGRDFSFGNFAQTDLTKADFRKARLAVTKLYMAILTEARFENAQLQGAILGYTQLQGAVLNNTQLQRGLLQEAQLQGADLNNAQLQGADLRKAQLQGASLWNSQLQGANLSYAQLQGANLSYAQLQIANLSSAQLQGTNLFQTLLQGADLSKAKLQGADARFVQINGINLTNAGLQGIRIFAAQIGQVSQLELQRWLNKADYFRNEFLNAHYLVRLKKLMQPSTMPQDLARIEAKWAQKNPSVESAFWQARQEILCQNWEVARNLLAQQPFYINSLNHLEKGQQDLAVFLRDSKDPQCQKVKAILLFTKREFLQEAREILAAPKSSEPKERKERQPFTD